MFAPLGLADIRPKTSKNGFNRCKENRLLILREGLNKSTESGTLNLNLPFSHLLRLGATERYAQSFSTRGFYYMRLP